MTEDGSGRTRRRRGPRRTDDEGPRGTARDRALRLLSVRDRSRRELEQRLLRAGFERDDVTETLDRLETSGLIDDERFARAVVEHETVGRRAGSRGIRSALFAKGVPTDVAERALSAAGDDAARAEDLALAKVGQMRRLAPEVAFRRLFGLLVRRGHDPAVARAAAIRALAVDPAAAEEP